MPTACDVNADLSITSNFLVIHLPLKSHKHSTEEISRFKFFFTPGCSVSKSFMGACETNQGLFVTQVERKSI